PHQYLALQFSQLTPEHKHNSISIRSTYIVFFLSD
ncbi:hypothetical protein D030_3276B, partial [Vibrio parahaemolyticus AQ3810]